MYRSCVLVALAVLILVTPSNLFAQLPQDRIVKAGVARVDTTPPPGYSTGGHGPAGTTARGYWMPLTATAFYFEDSNRTGAVLVSVDLFAVPSMFHQEIARAFEARGGQNTLALERIVIAATHTHHGTANFLSVAAHNRKASNVEGYDSRLRAFLVAKLITVVDAAIDDAARHQAFELDIITGSLTEKLFRNRSPDVFLENGNAKTMLDELGTGIDPDRDKCAGKRQSGEPRRKWRLKECPRLRAVDRNVSLLRLRRDGKTAAMAVFAAIHPTLLPSKTPLFTQDIFGIVRQTLENAAEPIAHVAFFNGAEGDITLRRTSRDLRDMAGLGEVFADELRAIHDGHAPRSITTGGIAGRLRFASPGDAAPSRGTLEGRLATYAMGGSEAIRGGEGDPGPLKGKVVSWLTRRTRSPRGEHGVKVPAVFGLEGLTDGEFPKHEFPTRLPLSVVTIGAVTFAVTPFEMNTSVGYAIRQALGRPRGELEIVGLANEYASYTASEDEYQEQDYMGAFTLWGPKQAAFVVASLRELRSAPAGSFGQPPRDMPGDGRVALGPHMLDEDRGKIFSGLGDFLDGEKPPAFCWSEPTPPDLPNAKARVVEIWRDGGGVIDRHNIAVVMLGRPHAGRARWAAIWLAPIVAQPQAGRFRFRVTTDGQPTITSNAFEATVETKDCTTIRYTPAR